VFSLFGLGASASTAGFMAAALLALYLRRPRLFGITAQGFFVIDFVAVVVLKSVLFIDFGTALAGLSLAGMTAFSLIKDIPFSLEYVRDDWPPLFWGDPVFRRTNRIISTVWLGLFVIIAFLGVVATPSSRPWLAALLPLLIAGGGAIYSIGFAAWYPLREGKRVLDAREPYHWPDPTFGPARPDGNTTHDVIVIGAGVGGLTAAALLARRGLRVLLVEQRFSPGGYCTSWERGIRTRANRDRRLRYVFDAGVYNVSGLGPRGTIRNKMRELGLEDRVTWQRMHHEYILPGGTRIKIPPDIKSFIEMLQAQFPAEKEHIARFFAQIELFNRELFLDTDRTNGIVLYPRTPQEYVAYPKTHSHAFYWMDRPYLKMLEAYFRDPQLRHLLTIITNYLTDAPETLTVLNVAPLFQYYFEGAYYPSGGAQAFPNALVESIQANGGKVLFRAPVRRILVENGRAVGIELESGAIHRAEAVISNADVLRTFAELLPPEHVPPDFLGRLTARKPSTSVFMVFLGLDYMPKLEPVTALALDGKELWIVITSKVDPSLAPEGCANLTLSRLIPHEEALTWDRTVKGYLGRKREAGDKLITLAEQVIPGLRAHIVYRQEASPATFTRFARTSDGAIYGMATGQPHTPMRSPIERLYMVGSSVFPGAGIEAAVTSGATAADLICPQPVEGNAS
jgi:phytoene dehydrogenase-like protein